MLTRILWFSAAIIPLAAAQAQEREQLRIEAPTFWGAWKNAREEQGNGVHFTAWVPANQQGTAWKESIAVAVLDPRPSGDAAVNAIRLILGSSVSACPNSNIVPPKPQSEGPFTVAYTQFYCPQSRTHGLGEVIFIKSISSERKVHLVSMMMRVKPFEIPSPGAIYFATDEAVAIFDWMKATSTYLSGTVKLCVGDQGKQEVCSP